MPIKKVYQICNRCIMDTSDIKIIFDKKGNCNHCNEAIERAKEVWFPNEEGAQKLISIVDKIKNEGENKPYDCIVGLSGGVDSSYLAYKIVELGLRPLVIHVDCGWNSELAVKNIENIVTKLNLELHTYVVNWQEMKDLQLSYFKASVANQDIPQDHAIFSAFYNFAVKHDIKYVFNGSNFATESILPQSWGYNNMDTKNLKSIHKKFGQKRLKTYPIMSFFKQYFYFRYFRKMTIVKPLNMMTYIKDEAIDLMKKELGWRYYGEKHHESRFTKFFQAYYLPSKFGYDKRRAHLSSLIVSKQLTRDEAVKEMNTEVYPNHSHIDDMEYVAKKLDVSLEEFQNIIKKPNKIYKDYNNNEKLFEMGFKLRNKFKTLKS